MLTPSDLKKIARARLKDAEELFLAKRFDGANYLCGYTIELALKARICRTLKWPGYPETRKEFEGLLSFKTHDLDILLKLTGWEDKIKATSLREWSIVSGWNPEARYHRVGAVTSARAQSMISAASILVKKL